MIVANWSVNSFDNRIQTWQKWAEKGRWRNANRLSLPFFPPRPPPFLSCARLNFALLVLILPVLFSLCLFYYVPTILSDSLAQATACPALEIKEDKCAKGLAKNQVCVILHMWDIRKNVLPKFIKLCMETPCLCLCEGDKYGRRKPTETSVFEFSY